MRTLPLGKTGVQVSALCFGAMYCGTRYDQATSYHVLDRYLDAGGTFIDTANNYAHWLEGFSGGESETMLNRWMRERGNRSRLFIATKVGFDSGDVERGLRAHQIEAECEKSLKRLGIDTIDLYYAHCDDRNTPVEETLEAFDRLVQAGKVRFIGASNYLSWRLERSLGASRANGWAEYCCIQQRYSYLRPMPGKRFDPQLAITDDLLECCKDNDVTVLAYSVLLNGALTHPDRELPEQYRGPDTDARLKVLREVAGETGATVNQVIMAWLLHSDPPVLPLISASSDAQLDENLGALDVQLSAEQMERLNNAQAVF
jgi:aryl-alcohol dehydrogenase-like predicted oxidoreductase